MEIEQYLYDLNNAGEAIIAYRMSNPSGGSVELCNMGASLLSFSLGSTPEGESIAKGECIWGVSTLEGAQTKESQSFAEHLWESRVEGNRVVMSREESAADGSLMVEVVFDFDDDNSFEITYIARSSYPTKVDFMHALTLLSPLSVEKDEALSQGHQFYVKGARRGILLNAGSLEELNMQLLSSQPAIYYDAQKRLMAACTPGEVALDEGETYVSKIVFRPKPSCEINSALLEDGNNNTEMLGADTCCGN